MGLLVVGSKIVIYTCLYMNDDSIQKSGLIALFQGR